MYLYRQKIGVGGSNKHDTNCGRKLFNKTQKSLGTSGVKTFTSIHVHPKKWRKINASTHSQSYFSAWT